MKQSNSLTPQSKRSVVSQSPISDYLKRYDAFLKQKPSDMFCQQVKALYGIDEETQKDREDVVEKEAIFDEEREAIERLEDSDRWVVQQERSYFNSFGD